MKSILIYTLVTVFIRPNLGAPFTLNEIFPEFVTNTKLSAPVKQQEIVKRQVIPANPDAQLKQISLHGLIGDLENSLFQSALSVNSAHKEGAIIEHITPPSAAVDNSQEHGISKREHTTESPEGNSHESTTFESAEAEARRIVLQTTKKVPESGGVPAHVLIDRISVQPHSGGVPLIPAFQVQHTKVISATIKDDPNSAENPAGAVGSVDKSKTHISIRKTLITATSVEAGEAVTTVTANTTDENTTIGVTEAASTLPETISDSIISTTTPTTPTTTTTTTAKSEISSTTKEPHEKIKSAEEKLKEKVAEIEAEPIILSARV